MSKRDWRKAQRPARHEVRARTQEDLFGWRVLSGGGCWCGEAMDHEWPDKAEGTPHPR